METHVLTLLFMLFHFLLSCRFLIYSSLIFSLMGCTPILRREQKHILQFSESVISSNGATKFFCVCSPLDKGELNFHLELFSLKVTLSQMKDINLSNVKVKKCLLQIEGKKIANQYYLELSSERVVSNWENFSGKKTFIMSNKTFSFMHKFRQQFFNSFRLTSLPLLARSFQLIWVKNSKGKLCLFTKVVRAKVTYMLDYDDEYEMKKIVVQFEGIICVTHLKRKFRLSWELNFIHFLSKIKTFPSIFIAAMLWFCSKNQKTLKYLWGGKVFCISS